MPQAAQDTIPPSPVTPGLLRRFAAMVYDSLLLMALALAYGALATWLNVLIQGPPEGRERMDWGNWEWLLFLGMVVVLVGFFCFFWRRSGQTLGMRAWRMALVDERLGKPGLKQCVLRSLLAPLSLGLLGLGYFWLWVDPNRQTLHGRLTGTRIILLPKEKN